MWVWERGRACAWVGMVASAGAGACGTTAVDIPADARGEPTVELEGYELACRQACDAELDVCGVVHRNCFEKCVDYPTQYPDCREELEAHYACVGAELWSCELFPLACSETAGALEVCLSGCSQGGVGELDAEGACACGGDLVGAAARSMTCEALDDGTGYACSCFADGTSVACVETDVSRVCDFTGGCCDFPPDGPAD